MHDLIIKKFRAKDFHNYVCNDRPCWVGVEVAGVFGYEHKRKAIFNCIQREHFEIGLDYDVLEGERLKVFKEIFGEQLEEYKYAPKLVIFYEEGLYGFLGYTEMPLGIEFRTWIRIEVMPTLRAKGYYVCDEEKMGVNYKNDTPNDVSRKTNHNTTGSKDYSGSNIDRLNAAYDSAMMFKELLDDITLDSTYKFLLIKQIYLDAGINLPRYIEEERF